MYSYDTNGFVYYTDHKKLYEMIYEKQNYDGTTKIDPHLWIYRPIITIDHVAQSLQQHKDLMKTMDLQILEEFIKNVLKTFYKLNFN